MTMPIAIIKVSKLWLCKKWLLFNKPIDNNIGIAMQCKLQIKEAANPAKSRFILNIDDI